MMPCKDFTCISVSLTGSRGSKVVAALRVSSLWEMWKMSNPLEPRRIDLKQKKEQQVVRKGDFNNNMSPTRGHKRCLLFKTFYKIHLKTKKEVESMKIL